MDGAKKVAAFLAVLAGAFLIAAISLRPPPAREGGVSLAAAMAHIRIIAKEPHPMGSAANATVRAYLEDELRKLGAEAELQPFTHTDRKGAAVQGANVIGTLPGSERVLSPVVLMAHYDSVPGSPGAADDAAGVAGALEAARILHAEGHRRDLIVLFTDGEEAGLLGAHMFFDEPRDVGAVINLEARGAAGRAGMFETGAGAGEFMRLFAREVRNPTTHSVAHIVYRYLPNDTDFTPARQKDLPGFNFAFIGKPGLYHSPLATPGRVDQGSVLHLGNLALDAARALTNAPTMESKGPYPVFSDVFGLFTITHAPVWGWLPIGLAALALIAAGVITHRQKPFSRRDFVVGFATGAGVIPLTGAALYGLDLLSGAGPKADYYDRLAQTGWLEIQAALLCLAVMLVLPRSRIPGWIGMLTLALGLAAAVQIFAPQAGPLFAWPALAASIGAVLYAAAKPKPYAWSIPTFLVLSVTAAFVLYWAHLLFVGAGQSLAPAMAPFAFLSLIALWPLIHGLPGRKPWAVLALALIIAAGGVALKVRLDPIPPEAVHA